MRVRLRVLGGARGAQRGQRGMGEGERGLGLSVLGRGGGSVGRGLIKQMREAGWFQQTQGRLGHSLGPHEVRPLTGLVHPEA